MDCSPPGLSVHGMLRNSTETRHTHKIPSGLVGIKITVNKIKNTPDRVSGSLDTAEEKNSEFEDIAI